MCEHFDVSFISRVQKSRIDNVHMKSIMLERTGKKQEVRSDCDWAKSVLITFTRYCTNNLSFRLYDFVLIFSDA